MNREVQLVKFRWGVPKRGFEFITSGGRRFLVEVETNEIGDEPRPIRLTRPLDETADLYTSFAALEVSEAAIVGFANLHGSLTTGRDTSAEAGGWRKGERLSLWKREVTAMSRTLDLWEAVRARKVTAIDELISSNGGFGLAHLLTLKAMWKVVVGGYERTPGTLGDRADLQHLDDAITRALSVIHSDCSKRLEKHTAFGLLYDPDIELPTALRNQRPRRGSLVQQAYPRNLLGGLWIQMATAIGSGREHRRCAGCEQWIAISPETRQSHSLYCRNACRATSHRRKRRQARELHADGVNVQEIARRLGTKIEHAKRWTRGEGRNRNL